MGEWILPTLFQVLSQEEVIPGMSGEHLSAAQRRVRMERQWAGAIAALEVLLQQVEPTPNPATSGSATSGPATSGPATSGPATAGIVLSGPLPVLSHAALLKQFKSWTFTSDHAVLSLQLPFQVPAAFEAIGKRGDTIRTMPLFPKDPLAEEQFCLVLTAKFSVILLLSHDEQGEPRFVYSFAPEAVDRVWQLLRLRVVMMRPQHSEAMDQLIEQFQPIAPDYKLVSQFSQMLLNYLPEPTGTMVSGPVLSAKELAAAVQQVAAREEADSSDAVEPSLDVELLQAIAHEVRTPLTTIRMLTRLLMKRQDMAPDAIKRLASIDRECSEQIDRFGFIFRAVELETSEKPGMALTTTCLAQIFEQSLPRWQQQASQRGLLLDVILPAQMPSVVTDPALLDQALSSLIDRSARSLPSGSTIQVEATIAGHQLKLQVQSNLADSTQQHKPLIKSLGQMLMFQPETGNLSLNLAVTKNLFQAMGGKMTVRQRSEEDEVFTIFLPIEATKPRK
jgi:signal transduction histidine kinase